MAISGFAFVGLSGVRAVTTPTTVENCLNGTDSIDTCNVSENVTISSVNVTRDIRLNITNNAKLTVNGTIAVTTGTLTITGGTVEGTSGDVIVVSGGASLTTSNVSINAAGTGNYGIVLKSGTNSKVNLNAGTILAGQNGIRVVTSGNAGNALDANLTGVTAEVDGVVFDVATSASPKITINSGSYTSKYGQVLSITGDAEVVVNGGTFTAAGTNDVTVYVSGGSEGPKLTINNGTFVSKGSYVIEATGTSNVTLKIADGRFEAANEDTYVIYKNSNASLKNFVEGGTFVGKVANFTGTNGVLATGKGYVTDPKTKEVTVGEVYTVTFDAIDETNGKVINLVGTTTNGLVDKVFNIGNYLTITPNEGYHAVYTVYDEEGIEYTVTKGSFTMPKKAVNVKVAFVEGEEPSEEPGETTDPGKGDNEIDHNANTGDNIMSYVTLAVSSLGALGVAVKKVVR